ncbi:MAG: type II toxin-antitoxin system VapC family toxin [Solimonas sp.]
MGRTEERRPQVVIPWGMALRLVLDNSVTTGWVHPDQATAYSTALLDQLARYQPLAPTLWPLEFGNTMLALLRRKKLTEAQWRSALVRAASWKIALDTRPPEFAVLGNLAIRHGLTVYDAAYLDSALRNRVRLATQDTALKKAALERKCWFDPEKMSAAS